MPSTPHPDTTKPVKAPRAVIAGILRVRASGATNMFVRGTVQRLAHENGDHATVAWIEDNPDLYGYAVMYGMVDEETGEHVDRAEWEQEDDRQ